jgi:hypothetical protein
MREKQQSRTGAMPSCIAPFRHPVRMPHRLSSALLFLGGRQVGATIDVLGRRMRIYDMEEPSRVLARSLLGREFAPCVGVPPSLAVSNTKTNAWGQPLRDHGSKAAPTAKPWEGRRDVLSYGVKLLSRSKEDEP